MHRQSTASGAGILLIVLLCTAGCQQNQPLSSEQVPADFSLVMAIRQSPSTAEHDPYGATVIVEPCGTLRAAQGPGCTLLTYPNPTTVLNRNEMQALYEIARRIDFSQDMPNDTQDAVQVVVYGNACQSKAVIKLDEITEVDSSEWQANTRTARDLIEVICQHAGLGYRYKPPIGSYRR